MVPDAVNPPELPVTLAVPMLQLVAKPLLAMVATPGLADAQAVDAVRSWVLPSLNVPNVLSCSVVPNPIEESAGVIAIAVRTGGVTVSVPVPLADPDVTVIVVVPTVRAVASPELLIEATLAAEAPQTAWLVKSFVLWLLKVPVTVNCCVSPLAMVAVDGDNERETRLGADTVSVAEMLTEPDAAVIVALPACKVTAMPAELMVAIVG